jgi:hypothetical protein
MLTTTFYILINELSILIMTFNILTGYLLQGEKDVPWSLPVGKSFRGKMRGFYVSACG